MFCTHCGKPIIENNRFCTSCGKPVNQTPPADTSYLTSNGIQVIKQVYTRDAIFQFTCTSCGTVFRYKKEHLGYRKWYPNGFVYCPGCKRPCRHHPIENLLQP